MKWLHSMRMTGPMTRRRAVLLLALAALLYTAPGFLPGQRLLPLDLLSDFGAWKADPDERRPASNHLLADVMMAYVPWDAEVRRHLAAGEPPWVDRFSGGGTPLFANPQTALLSPFTWPRLMLGEAGWTWSVFLRLFLAGLGAFWLARVLGARPAAATFSGFVYMASGHSVVWSQFATANVTAVMPFLAASLIQLSRRVSARNAGAVVLFAALATAGGHPETLMTAVVATFALLIWEWWGDRSRHLVWCATAAAIGFFCLACVLVPFFYLVMESEAMAVRSGGGEHSFRYLAVAGQILPGFLGGPLGDEIDLSRIGAGNETFLMRSDTFVGAVLLLALVLTARRLPTTLRRALVIGTVGLVLSWAPPLIESLLVRLPLVELAWPAYRGTGFVLFASAAAGPALAVLGRHRRGGMWLAAAGAAILFAGLLPAIRPLALTVSRTGIAAMHERGHLPNPIEVYEERLPEYLEAVKITALRRWAAPGACWLVAGLALASRSGRRSRWVAGAAAAELLAFGIGFVPAMPTTADPGEPATFATIRDLDPRQSFELIAGRGVLPPNVATRYELRDARSYVVIENLDRMTWMRSAGYRPSEHLSFPADLGPDQLAELARHGVRFFLSREPVTGCERIGGDEPPAVGLYELPGTMPVSLPENRPPRGLLPGAILSTAALFAAAALVTIARRPRQDAAARRGDSWLH